MVFFFNNLGNKCICVVFFSMNNKSIGLSLANYNSLNNFIEHTLINQFGNLKTGINFF